MQKITNRNEISLEMAVWLLHDEYDYIDDPNYISATSLMRPIRHILLPGRIPIEDRIVPDVEDFIASQLGNALHAAIEKSWSSPAHVARSLQILGYPAEVVQRVLVNPSDEELTQVEDPIPVYLEQRFFREIDGFQIGGKFDMVAEGRVTDTKSTSVWAWIKGGRDQDHILQGSIYRWLAPHIITEDFIRINYIFTDWSRADSQRIEGYPPRRVMHRDLPLMSIEETEAWIRAKLAEVVKYRDAPEDQLPLCTDEELWMTAPQFRYYANPANASLENRSTRNFDTMEEAQTHLSTKGRGKGVILTKPGEPKRCDYCAAFPICTQKNQYFPQEVIDA